MIEMMRSRVATWVARILAFFLIIAFAIWGIEDMIRLPSGAELGLYEPRHPSPLTG